MKTQPASVRGLGASRRLVVYSHDGFGLGHLKRNYNIATQLLAQAPDLNILLLASCSNSPQIDLLPGMDLIKLPSFKKVGDERWEPRTLNISSESLIEGRRTLIRNSIDWFEPDLLLVDYMPRGIYGELDEVLGYIRDHRKNTKCVLGLRDIIDEPNRLHQRWVKDQTYAFIDEMFDNILIYGSPNFYPTTEHYKLDLLPNVDIDSVGYVSGVRGRKNVLPTYDLAVVGGGGADAFPMISAVLKALQQIKSRRPTTIVATGPLMPLEQRRELEQMAKDLLVTIQTGPVDQVAIMASAKALITMAGYNTVVESIELARPSLVIPRPGPSAEQTIRAQRMTELGLCRTLTLTDANPEVLARDIQDLVRSAGRTDSCFQLCASTFPADGAAKAASLIIELMGWQETPDVSSNPLSGKKVRSPVQ